MKRFYETPELMKRWGIDEADLAERILDGLDFMWKECPADIDTQKYEACKTVLQWFHNYDQTGELLPPAFVHIAMADSGWFLSIKYPLFPVHGKDDPKRKDDEERYAKRYDANIQGCLLDGIQQVLSSLRFPVEEVDKFDHVFSSKIFDFKPHLCLLIFKGKKMPLTPKESKFFEELFRIPGESTTGEVMASQLKCDRDYVKQIKSRLLEKYPELEVHEAIMGSPHHGYRLNPGLLDEITFR